MQQHKKNKNKIVALFMLVIMLLASSGIALTVSATDAASDSSSDSSMSDPSSSDSSLPADENDASTDSAPDEQPDGSSNSPEESSSESGSQNVSTSEVESGASTEDLSGSDVEEEPAEDDDSSGDDSGIAVEYDAQPASLQEVSEIIGKYNNDVVDAYNQKDDNALAAALSAKPHWQEQIPAENMPEQYTCELVEAGVDTDFPAAYYSFFIVYDVQPQTAEEVLAAVNEYEEAGGDTESDAEKRKPHWQQNVPPEMMPSEYTCISVPVGQNPDFVAPYYTFALTGTPRGGEAMNVWDGSSTAAFSAGDGSQDDPYIISSAANLAYLAQEINNGNHNSTGKYYRLESDIDLNNQEWTPIGLSGIKLLISHTAVNSPRAGADYFPFRGIFLGNGKTISNLKVTAPWGPNVAANDYKGLFGLIEDASISGVTINTAVIDGGAATGTLAGYAYGEVSISDCVIIDATVTSKNTQYSNNFGIGGLLGVFDMEETTKRHTLNILGCTVSNVTMGSRTAVASGEIGIGGVLGMARSYFAGSVSAANAQVVISNITVSGNVSLDPGAGNVVGTGAGGVLGSVYYLNSDDSRVVLQDINASVNITSNSPNRRGFSGVVGSIELSNSSNNTVTITRPVVNAAIKGMALTNPGKGGVLGYGNIAGGNGNTVTIDGAGSVGGEITSSLGTGAGTGGIVGSFDTTGTATKLFISNISVSAPVTVSGAGSPHTGGAIGSFSAHGGTQNELHIDGVNVTAPVNVTASSSNSIGGIAGRVGFATSETATSNQSALTLINCTMSGSVTGAGGDDYYVGGIIGYFDASQQVKEITGIIKNCHASGDVSANDYYVGGVIGYSYIYGSDTHLTIDACSASGNVTSTNYYSGGFAGYLEITETQPGTIQSTTTVSNSYATGNVSGRVYDHGGFVGHAHGGANSPLTVMKFENCWASGDVTSNGHGTGGFIGRPEKGTAFTNCWASGDVTGTNYSGGFTGWQRTNEAAAGLYENCYATGNVYGTGQSGGFAGHMDASIVTNCYSVGSVRGAGGTTGGFVGALATKKSYFENCYATGTVVTPSAGAGRGFVGAGGTTYGNFTNCFFDITTTTMTNGGASSIRGVSTKEMLKSETFTGWNMLNVWHVSLSGRQQSNPSPWYIDQDATYPYLYYQADGYDTDGDGLGDGYLDPQHQFATDFDNTNYFIGVLYYNNGPDDATANDSLLAALRYDFSFDTAQNLSFRAMSIGSPRVYFPYAYNGNPANYNQYQFWFEDGVKNSDTDGPSWVSTYRTGKVSFRTGQKISFGSYSRTNIVAFSAGPYAQKTNNSSTWQFNTQSSYTFVGSKITYRVDFTNYCPIADWKNIALSDPLEVGVTLTNNFVFLYRNGQELHLKNYTDVPEAERPKAQAQLDSEGNGETAEPYFLYEMGTGVNAGRYILTILNLPELTYAQRQGDSMVFDTMYVEFVAQVGLDALSGSYPVASLDESTYRDIDNIRNIGTVTGTMHYWNPETLFSGAPVKEPLLDENGQPVRIDVAIKVDDKDRDPVYLDFWVGYNSNYRSIDPALTDEFQIKDYLLSDLSHAHTVIPNDDPNAPAIIPSERKDYTEFIPPGPQYRFGGWFYFKDPAGETAYENRADAAMPPDENDIVFIEISQIISTYVLNPAADTSLQNRNITLYARWELIGPTLTFTKTDAEGQPLPGAAFDLYWWSGGAAPGDTQQYVTPQNIGNGQWEKQNESPILSDANGLVEVLFPQTGLFQLVETTVATGYYTPHVQWRFTADADANPQTLSDPVTVPQSDAEAVVIHFTSTGSGDAKTWFLVNYRKTEFHFLKVSVAGAADTEQPGPVALQGAKFDIYLWKGSSPPTGSDALVTASSTAPNKWMLFAQSVSEADGRVHFALAMVPGWIYQLVENEAAPNYKTPTGQWRLSFAADGSIDTGAITAVAGLDGQLPPAFQIVPDGAWQGELALYNVPVYLLPQLGGIGKPPYIAAGLALVGGALAAGIVARRRKRRRRTGPPRKRVYKAQRAP